MAEKENLRYSKQFVPRIKSYDPINHTMVFTITTPALDSYGERVNPDGVKFAPHPKFLHNHDRSGMPIGWIKWVGREGNEWKAMSEFDQEDPLAVMLERKYSTGQMTDCSVGFISNINEITKEKDGSIVHNDTLVKEFSLVTFGANPEAIAKSEFSIEELEDISQKAVCSRVKSFFENIKKDKVVEQNTKAEDEIVKSLENKFEDLQLHVDEISNDLVEIEQRAIMSEKAIEKMESIETEISQLKSTIESLTNNLNEKIKSQEAELIKNTLERLAVKSLSKIKIKQ